VILSKKRAALVVLVPAGALLGLSALPWATGEARDVLAHGTTEVAGGTAAPGVPGLAAVCVVALLGVMTGGRVIRAVAAGALVVASLAGAVLTVLAVARPGDVVAAEVAHELARTTAPTATGSATVWGWLAVLAAVVLVAASVTAAASSRSWSGLSGRYERAARPESGPRGEVRTAWDALSEGTDPTLDDARDEN
jgi:hypothetical protein